MFNIFNLHGCGIIHHMTLIQTIIFSIIEAVTEFLPVSSTAHLLLTEKLLPVADPDLFANFSVVIQLGAIAAVIFLFFSSVWANKQTWLKLILAVLPTAVLGFLLADVVDAYMSDASVWTGVMLIVFGVIFSLLDWYWTRGQKEVEVTDEELTTGWVKEVEKTPWYKMLGVGLGQSLALLPGVSRSGASIYTARALGFSKVAATALSFIVGVAVIAGASGLSVVKHRDEFLTLNPECPCCSPAPGMLGCCDCAAWTAAHSGWHSPLAISLIGIIVTFAISFFLAKPLLKFLATKPFWYFGVWRVIVGLVWLFLFWPGK